LERRVIKTHPEYRQVICWLPTWIGADPHEIVKYDGRSRPAPSGGALTLGWRLGLASGFVFLALNVYYRGVVRLRTPG
jgi:hypothetical protein